MILARSDKWRRHRAPTAKAGFAKELPSLDALPWSDAELQEAERQGVAVTGGTRTASIDGAPDDTKPIKIWYSHAALCIPRVCEWRHFRRRA